MFDELLKNVAELRNNAQDKRRRACVATDESERKRLFDAAISELSTAILALERSLRIARRKQDGYTPDICRLLKALSETCGSLGGTWRDAGDYSQAREKYDTGNEYEDQRRKHCGAMDTYNMLQRLVVRLLEVPGRLEEPAFKKELGAVREELEREMDAGRDDSWGIADLAQANFLLGFSADAAIAFLDRRNAEPNFYESTYAAVAALVNEGFGREDELGRRLDDFLRLLKRKGGIR